jgi:hypothetical protein
MSRFRVSFDGQWQEDFDTLDEAEEWAQEVSSTGRMAWVVERRPFFLVRLRRVFPEDRELEGKKAWRREQRWYLMGGSG